eukprot:350699-Chlamydomonas_euryale.AAC.3
MEANPLGLAGTLKQRSNCNGVSHECKRRRHNAQMPTSKEDHAWHPARRGGGGARSNTASARPFRCAALAARPSYHSRTVVPVHSVGFAAVVAPRISDQLCNARAHSSIRASVRMASMHAGRPLA